MAEIKDKMVTVESLAASHEHNQNTYMTKVDPIGSGTFTLDGAALRYDESIGALILSFPNNNNE